MTVIGHSIGALGDPVWGGGAVSLPRGRAVVDERLGVIKGETLTLGARRLRVAGVVHDRTAFGGQPADFVRRLGVQTSLRGRAEPTELATPIGEQARAQAVLVATNQRQRHG